MYRGEGRRWFDQEASASNILIEESATLLQAMNGLCRAVFGGSSKHRMVLDNGPDRGKRLDDSTVKSWRRDGDWLCPNSGCKNVNFAFRKFCNRCGVARLAGASGTD